MMRKGIAGCALTPRCARFPSPPARLSWPQLQTATPTRVAHTAAIGITTEAGAPPGWRGQASRTVDVDRALVLPEQVERPANLLEVGHVVRVEARRLLEELQRLGHLALLPLDQRLGVDGILAHPIALLRDSAGGEQPRRAGQQNADVCPPNPHKNAAPRPIPRDFPPPPRPEHAVSAHTRTCSCCSMSFKQSLNSCRMYSRWTCQFRRSRRVVLTDMPPPHTLPPADCGGVCLAANPPALSLTQRTCPAKLLFFKKISLQTGVHGYTV